MTPLAEIDLFADAQHAAEAVHFRARDTYSLSDKRRCLRLAGGDQAQFAFDLSGADIPAGTAELCLTASLEVLDSHAYVYKFLNSLLTVRLNGETVFDGMVHWRSHEETASYWPTFDFAFDSALLQPGANTVAVTNRSSREALGEFFDPQLLDEFDDAAAERKLTTIYLSDLAVVHALAPKTYPALAGCPTSALAGQAFILEVSTGPEQEPVTVVGSDNAAVAELGAELEFGEWRTLFEVTPTNAGEPVRVAFEAGDTTLPAETPHVYADAGADRLITGPGAETTYWHRLKPAAQDFFALESGNCFRISIDDFLSNLHIVPLEKWRALIKYLIRRRRYYALQRIRVPHYSRIQHHELAELADLGGGLFTGVSVVEPILHLHRGGTADEPDLAKRLKAYLTYFRERMEAVRLPGHPVVTFDSAGAMCGHYYALGLDVHLSELGPACNVFEEACMRGAAQVYGKPWGTTTAMHWYCGQGAKYAYDDARVRYARLNMVHAYLAGARQILWEGGVFDNQPVYNFILSEESWRDFGRRYDHPHLAAVRRNFRELLDLHRAQQLPQPRARFGVVRGINDLSRGFDASTSRYGDMSMARAWTLLKVFLPHVSFGNIDHGREVRRWYSATPYGQVDVVPAEAAAADFSRYNLLVFTGWNTMTEELYGKLVEYVKGGGTLFIALPHFCTDTIQRLEWTFFNDGDLSELCGVKAHDLGGRIEAVDFADDQFEPHLPRRFVLSRQNQLFVEDFDEKYTVFGKDVTYFGGELTVTDADVLATSQRGEPVLLRRRLGQGQTYLLNSYCHPGRGNLLPLAEGILRALADEAPTPLTIDDPAQVVSWFEYPEAEFSRYIFINTDWTSADAGAETTVTIGGDAIALRLEPAHPVQIVSDGKLHVVLEDPAAQLVSWQKNAAAYDIAVVNGQPTSIIAANADRPVAVNGQAI